MNSILADAIRACDQIRTPCGISGTIRKALDELLRLLDETPADYEWAESVRLAEGDGLYCAMCGDWWVGVQCISKKTRGQVRCLAKAFGRELKEDK